MVRPKERAADLVGSRARDQLHLSCATAHLGIRRRDNDADFFDQVRSDVGDGIRAGVVPAVGNDHAV